MVQRVLVAIDGTDASRRVLQIACALADKYEAALGLLSVVDAAHVGDGFIHAAEVEGMIPDNASYTSYYDTSLAEYGASERVSATVHAEQATRLATVISDTIVAEAAAYSKESPFLSIKTFVRSGSPAKAILKVAQEQNADIILMGHDQQNRFEEILKGSVAEKVQRKARCPVLIYSMPKSK